MYIYTIFTENVPMYIKHNLFFIATQIEKNTHKICKKKSKRRHGKTKKKSGGLKWRGQ